MTQQNQRLSRRCTRVLIAPVLATAIAVTGVPIGLTAVANAVTPAAQPKPPSWRDVKDARKKLVALSDEVGRTKAWVEKSEERLAAAHERENAAANRASEARAAVARAQEAVAAAKVKVEQQQIEVDRQQAIIDALLLEVAKLARNTYIDGGEYKTLAMIMETQSPGDYANQREAVKRTSSDNARVYDQLEAAKALLIVKLDQLQKLKDAAAARQAEAEAKAEQAQAAQEQAQQSRIEAAEIVDQRNEALNKVAEQRGEMKKIYQKVLDEYEAANAEPGGSGSTRVPGAKVKILRSGRAVIDWAMQYVGNGEWYDHLCLGFVDDAYGAQDGRMPRAIDQWYRAKDAGLAHPDDRTPPIGAQVFWWSANDAKHVALYAGGGMVITTGGDGSRVAIVSMDYLDSYGPYLGWAPGYYG